MANLQTVLNGFTGEGAVHRVEAPDNWKQGRTLYGGMTAALCWHAATRAFPDLPPLRSAQVSFVGPAQGMMDFTCTLLRRGRNSAIVQVMCQTEAGHAAAAIFTCAAARDSAVAHDFRPAPESPSPEDCEDFHRKPPKSLGFPANFDIKLISGNRPLTGGAPEMTVWTRLKEDEGVDPVTVLLAVADALPPGAMTQMSEWAPISTMTWAVDFFQPVSALGWHKLHTYSEQCADGYSLQGSDMWDRDGRRVLVARQVVAVFG
ncbi:MAG: acyl-CoA thioesterase [Pseudooceanicola sp.]